MNAKKCSANAYCRIRPLLRFVWIAVVAIFTASSAHAGDSQNEATEILKSMSEYLVAENTITFTFDSDIEVITPQLEKIQFASSGEAWLSRPDKLRAHRVGGYSDVLLNFDGEITSIYGKHINGFARIVAPGTVDQLIHALREGHGVSLPGADLLLPNAYEVLSADVMEAKYMGRGVIDGVECEHLAFRNFDTDWQLWVETGDRPFPRKLVITSKTIASGPQYTLRIKSWDTGVTFPASTFSFVPPADAVTLDANALIELDELPHEQDSGGTP